MKKIALIFALFVGSFATQAQTTAAEAANEIPKPAINLSEYAGKFKMEGLPFEHIIISVKEDKLYIEAGDREGFLDPIADKPETFDAAGQANIKFVRNAETKKVEKLLVEAMGMNFEGKKEE